MNNANQTPAACDDRERRVQVILEKDMAETVTRLDYFNRVLDLVKGSLKVELGLPNKIEDAEGEKTS